MLPVYYMLCAWEGSHKHTRTHIGRFSVVDASKRQTECRLYNTFTAHTFNGRACEYSVS